MASKAECGTPSEMADDQNPHSIAHDAKEKVVGKALQIDAAKVAHAYRERLGPFRGLLHEQPQLTVKVVRKFGRGEQQTILKQVVDALKG